MFENSGSKIKVLALINFWLGAISSVICGLIIINFALLIIPAGIFVSWLSSIVLYGIGEGIENSDDILNKLSKQSNEISSLKREIELIKGGESSKAEAKAEKTPNTNRSDLMEQRLKNLKSMRESGVITEESYAESIKKLAEEQKDDNLERPGKKLNTDFSGSEASSTHKWKCMKCGQRISSLPCPYCSDK